MKTHASPLMLLAVLLLLASATLFSQAADDNSNSSKRPFDIPKQYSLNGSCTVDGRPDMAIKVVVYADGEKAHIELPTGTSIIRPDQKKIYDLKADSKTYTERAYSADSDPIKMYFPEGAWTSAGNEYVNGVTTEKYKLEGPEMGPYAYYVDPASKRLVRLVMEKLKLTIDFTDFKAGPQSPKLFEVPSDYAKGNGLPVARP